MQYHTYVIRLQLQPEILICFQLRFKTLFNTLQDDHTLTVLLLRQINHATGYASQHIWCLSQARIKWEGCGMKGIQRKNRGMMAVGHWLVPTDYDPKALEVIISHMVSVSAFYLPFHHKSPAEDFSPR